MFRLLIVDDESIIRNGLKESFDWSRYKISKIETASNGREAIRIIDEFKPHIVLTDIHMPEIDGLELAKYIYINHPLIYTVFLSAYDDFKYAQKAIEYNIKGYILKPVTQNSLNDVFLHISDGMNRSYVDQNQKVLISILTNDKKLYNNDVKIYKSIKAMYYGKYTRIAVFRFKEKDSDTAIIINDNADIISSLSFFEEREIPAVIYMNYLVICFMSNVTITRVQVIDAITDYEKHLAQINNTYITNAGIGDNTSKYPELSNSFSQAIYVLNSKYFRTSTSILFFQDISYNLIDDKDYNNSINDYIALLSKAIISGEIQQISNGEKLMFNYILYKSKNNVQTIKLYILDSLLSVYMELITHNMKFEYDPHELTQNICLATNIPRLREVFSETINQFIAIQMPETKTSDHWMIAETKKYILENYNNSISLKDISQKLHVNKNYLSGKFKRFTGMTVTEYIIEIKMTQACRLLSDPNISIREVSYRAGYRDYPYFSKLFKKQYKQTPMQYRKKLL